MENKQIVGQLVEDYAAALIDGDSREAARIVSTALASGVDISTIYLEIIAGAQCRLGELWLKGEISVSEEHAATQISFEQMGRLRQVMRPRERLGLRAVITSPLGDEHFLGARMIADLLFLDGWHVHNLGANTPPEDLAEYVTNKGADLVGISVSLPQHLNAAKAAIEAVRRRSPQAKIMIGGQGVIAARPQADSLGADCVVENGQRAVHEARKLFGTGDRKNSLNQVLREIGTRICERRKFLKLSQEQLAKMSDLDRAYISSLENGKQNMTIGVLMRLAEALDLSLWNLLDRNFEIRSDM